MDSIRVATHTFFQLFIIMIIKYGSEWLNDNKSFAYTHAFHCSTMRCNYTVNAMHVEGVKQRGVDWHISIAPSHTAEAVFDEMKRQILQRTYAVSSISFLREMPLTIKRQTSWKDLKMHKLITVSDYIHKTKKHITVRCAETATKHRVEGRDH
jgi:hypothetical protein